ncbi:MAG: hypothetical protein AB1696_25375 [Planctomycetota bacterium]
MFKTSRLAKITLILGAISALSFLLFWGLAFSKPHDFDVSDMDPGDSAYYFVAYQYVLPALFCTCFVGGWVAVAVGAVAGKKRRGRIGGAGMILGVLPALLMLPLLYLRVRIPREVRLFKANEIEMKSSLRCLALSQLTFQERRAVDQDEDGVGEFGYLSELCGETVPRNKDMKVKEPIPAQISRQLRTGGALGDGTGDRYGYYFRVYLIGKNGQATDDRACDGTPTTPSACLDPRTDQAAIDMQEKHFVIYAWPIKANETGRGAFVVNELAQVYSTKMENKTYSGPNGPSVEAFFNANGIRPDGWNDEDWPDEVKGNDGNIWRMGGLW